MQDLIVPTRNWTHPALHWKHGVFFFFDWKIIYLQYCGGFCHTSAWISLGCTCVSSSWNPTTNLPPHPIPLGCPRAVALSTLPHASILHWSSILLMVYMFQCNSLKSSYRHLLPQSPKVCSLHLCLFCCLAYRVVVTIFLNSICVC